MNKAEFIKTWRPIRDIAKPQFEADLNSLMQLPDRNEAEKESEQTSFNFTLRSNYPYDRKSVKEGMMWMYDWLASRQPEQPEALKSCLQCANENPRGDCFIKGCINWSKFVRYGEAKPQQSTTGTAPAYQKGSAMDNLIHAKPINSVIDRIDPEGTSPLTSIRRSITNLTKAGILVQSHAKSQGIYGRQNLTWYYPEKNYQKQLF